jgi:small subunit ribosomal protein YMR-31
MHASLRVFSANIHQPLIKFLGKRNWPSSKLIVALEILPSRKAGAAGPDMPHAHPAAPSELKKSFSDFGRTFEATSSSSPLKTHRKDVFPEFWEAPDRFWRPKVRELEAAEIDAILVRNAHSDLYED